MFEYEPKNVKDFSYISSSFLLYFLVFVFSNHLLFWFLILLFYNEYHSTGISHLLLPEWMAAWLAGWLAAWMNCKTFLLSFGCINFYYYYFWWQLQCGTFELMEMVWNSGAYYILAIIIIIIIIIIITNATVYIDIPGHILLLVCCVVLKFI